MAAVEFAFRYFTASESSTGPAVEHVRSTSLLFRNRHESNKALLIGTVLIKGPLARSRHLQAYFH